MKYIQLTKGKQAIVDDEDFENIVKYKWYYSTLGYAVRGFRINGKQFKVYMHSAIMCTRKGNAIARKYFGDFAHVNQL